MFLIVITMVITFSIAIFVIAVIISGFIIMIIIKSITITNIVIISTCYVEHFLFIIVVMLFMLIIYHC